MPTENAGGGDVTRSLELLWRGRADTVRGPRPTLSIEAIVDAAVALADREGIEAVSMRRVAAELSAGTMTLYRYVPAKSELLDLMIDSIVTGPDPDAVEKGWRATLESLGRASWQEFVTHPWLLSINQARQPLGPNTVRLMETTLSGMHDIDLGGRDRIRMVMAVLHSVDGCARNYLQHEQLVRETGMSDEAFWAAQLPVIETAMSSGNYPHLAALEDDAWDIKADEALELVLATVLDGLERFVASARGPR